MDQIAQFISNHLFLFGALIFVLVMIVTTEMTSLTGGFKRVDAATAVRLHNQEDAVFIDTRGIEEYRSGHIANALHVLPSDISETNKALQKINGKPTIVYCQTGMQASKACASLKKAGFGPIYLLQGGIGSWIAANYPLEKGKG